MILNSDDNHDVDMFFHFMDLARPSKGEQLHASLLMFPLSSETKATDFRQRHNDLSQSRNLQFGATFSLSRDVFTQLCLSEKQRCLQGKWAYSNLYNQNSKAIASQNPHVSAWTFSADCS